MSTSNKRAGGLNDKVCKNCLKRRGEHYFTSGPILSCQMQNTHPDTSYFEWNSTYRNKRSDINPNNAFRRKNNV